MQHLMQGHEISIRCSPRQRTMALLVCSLWAMLPACTYKRDHSDGRCVNVLPPSFVSFVTLLSAIEEFTPRIAPLFAQAAHACAVLCCAASLCPLVPSESDTAIVEAILKALGDDALKVEFLRDPDLSGI